MEQTVPEARFDEFEAVRVFPRPVVKHAVLIPIPRTEDGMDIPTFIRPSWGGRQVFYGDYYGFVKDGKVDYGSAKEQWEAMHAEIEPGYWVKTGIPTAYQAVAPCRIVTLIPSDDGGIREANYVLAPGDWVLRQPGGEIQHVKQANYPAIYFTQDEAVELGLTTMTNGSFADWALAHCRGSVPSL